MDHIDGARALEELRWLERLARRLVDDPETASDLTQEALLASLQSETIPASRRRPWLLGTLKNLASKSARGRYRRAGYEERGARVEALASAEVLAERAELQRVLLGVVSGLPERYRTPILMRYYDDVSVAAIAEQLGIPPRTVHTQLHRGMALLRERMDTEHPEGRAGWTAALLLAPWRAEVPPLPQMGASVFPAWTVPALCGVGLVALAAVVRSATKVLPTEVDADVTTAAAGMPTAALVNPPSAGPKRSPVSSLLPDDTVSAKPLVGRVVDWNQAPLAGALIRSRSVNGIEFPAEKAQPVELMLGSDNVPVGASGDDGTFALLAKDGRFLLKAEAPGYVCTVGAVWEPGANGPDIRSSVTSPPFLAMAPARKFEARVIDEEGRPLEGASAWVTLDDRVLARFGHSFKHQRRLHWSATSGPDGTLSFDDVPWVAEAQLTVQRDDYGERSWVLRDAPMDLALGDVCRVRVRGHVTDGRGAALPGATIRAGGRIATTDGAGAFTLGFWEAPAEIWAVAPGHGPQGFEVGNGFVDGRVDVGPLVLESSAALAGRVMGANGMPLSNMLVWAPRSAASDSLHPLVLESVAAGGDGYHHSALSDAEGRFELRGMAPHHEYHLRVSDPLTAQWVERGPFRAGQSVELLLPADHMLDRLAGQLLTLDGDPLVGASVSVQGPGYGVGQSVTYHHGSRALTDARGSFVLDNVPTKGVWLRASHPQSLLSTSPIGSRLEEREWRVPLAASLRVELVDSANSPRIQLRDAEGQQLTIWKFSGIGRKGLLEVPVAGDATPVLSVPCHATTLVLLRSGCEDSLVPIQLRPGETLRLTL